ncbi:MAG: branched-chain amino acid ABC transporter permease [Candidatus Rokubacteria bacterium]|nr:branched-chain amino acid ABC transporter permease [Candidatus Rokubacteria bacterium]
METRRLPVEALVGAALLVAVPFVLPAWMKFIVTLALAKFMAVLAVALFLRANQVTFGHAMFYAVGAYAVGFGAKWFGLRDVALLLPLGALFGAAVAALVGLVMARYREVFFAMLNLAFSMMLYGALLKLYWVTGGTDGLSAGVPTFLGYAPPREYLRDFLYYTSLGVAGLVIYAVYRFLASPLGYYLKAMGENEIRIEYSGESVRHVMYVTYVLSGALAGLGGVLAGFTVGHIVPEYSFWIQSGDFVFVALLGGYGSVVGPLMGSIAFEFIRTYASKYFPNEWQMTLGIIMLAIILFRPGGLWTIYEGLAARFGRREVERA